MVDGGAHPARVDARARVRGQQGDGPPGPRRARQGRPARAPAGQRHVRAPSAATAGLRPQPHARRAGHALARRRFRQPRRGHRGGHRRASRPTSSGTGSSCGAATACSTCCAASSSTTARRCCTGRGSAASSCPGLESSTRLSGSLSTVLAEDYGLAPTRSESELEVVRATREETTLLQVAGDVPLVVVTATTYLPNGHPLEHSQLAWLGDRVRFHVTAYATRGGRLMQSAAAQQASARCPDSVSESLDELARIGGGPGGGVTRVSWSPELFAAYAWVGDRMRALGLEVEIDQAGNLIGRWDAGSGTPVAGRLASRHRAVGRAPRRRPRRRRGRPRRGAAEAGGLPAAAADLDRRVHGRGGHALRRGAVRQPRVRRRGRQRRSASAPTPPARRCATPCASAATTSSASPSANRIDDVGAYLELHIEQGPVLEAEGVEIGVVTSIVGLRGYRVRLRGQANHAGTTPMRLRRDAFAGAARIALELREIARARDGITANVGKRHGRARRRERRPRLRRLHDRRPRRDARGRGGAGAAGRRDGGAHRARGAAWRPSSSRPTCSSRSSSIPSSSMRSSAPRPRRARRRAGCRAARGTTRWWSGGACPPR